MSTQNRNTQDLLKNYYQQKQSIANYKNQINDSKCFIKKDEIVQKFKHQSFQKQENSNQQKDAPKIDVKLDDKKVIKSTKKLVEQAAKNYINSPYLLTVKSQPQLKIHETHSKKYFTILANQISLQKE